jgi:hypothetical protein
MRTEAYYNTLQNVQVLTVAQERAIDILSLGLSDSEAARRAGVHRVTVTNWRLHHPGFRAALDARRAAIWQAFQDRTRALMLDALDAVAFGFSPGSNSAAQVALNFLELGGIRSANLGLIGPSDAEEIWTKRSSRTRGARSAERRRAELGHCARPCALRS